MIYYIKVTFGPHNNLSVLLFYNTYLNTATKSYQVYINEIFQLA